MSFDTDLDAMQIELTRTLKYKKAYAVVMELRSASEPLPSEALDEIASALGAAIGTCLAEMEVILKQLRSAYAAAAAAAEETTAEEPVLTTTAALPQTSG
jgi:hypothetical protein